MPRFITLSEVLAIHEDLVSTLGGMQGVRDMGLLESALAQPEVTFFGEFLHPTVWHQAAAYLYHLSRNHPFLDGNKRTALAVTLTFLQVNNQQVGLSQSELFDLVLSTAKGELEKEAIARKLKNTEV